MWYIHTMNQYSAIKRCELLIYATPLMVSQCVYWVKETRHKRTYCKIAGIYNYRKYIFILSHGYPLGVILSLREHLAMTEEFLIVITGEGMMLLASVGGDQECCKISCNSQHIPLTTKNSPTPSINCTSVDKPWKRVIKRKQIRCKLKPGTEGGNDHKETRPNSRGNRNRVHTSITSIKTHQNHASLK